MELSICSSLLLILLVTSTIEFGECYLCYTCGGKIGDLKNCDLPNFTTTIADCNIGAGGNCITATYIRNDTDVETRIVTRGCVFDYDCVNSHPYPKYELVYCNSCEDDLCNEKVFT